MVSFILVYCTTKRTSLLDLYMGWAVFHNQCLILSLSSRECVVIRFYIGLLIYIYIVYACMYLLTNNVGRQNYMTLFILHWTQEAFLEWLCKIVPWILKWHCKVCVQSICQKGMDAFVFLCLLKLFSICLTILALSFSKESYCWDGMGSKQCPVPKVQGQFHDNRNRVVQSNYRQKSFTILL